ncbi:hypothetical protein A9Q68_09740 [Streptococcus bovimastitidis]|uniref:Uncharacterized protein n=1 Tax=Streptococcus bovimastitidis TaxID=1856638 RepID=A0A1L8MKY9_9STRE|nr:hypothetical protein [Streptococcus bovimastitidis]OJF71450.1 hypothetical protein A9Q68_09740 [Streptococcus bovimastitidis]
MLGVLFKSFHFVLLGWFSLAGALFLAFSCTLRTPHGGIFVLPTIGHTLMYALAILIGSVVGCLILAILKKPLPNEE